MTQALTLETAGFNGAADLRWFFDDAAGQLGARSNHGAVVAMLERGSADTSGSANDSAGTDRAAAAERWSRINRTLRRLSEVERLVLTRAYGPTDWPRAATWGRSAGVVALTTAAEQGHERDLARVASALAGAWGGAIAPIEARQRAVAAHPELASVDGWLAAVAKRSRDKASKLRAADELLVAAIRAEALALLEGAEAAYTRARPWRRARC